MSTDSVLLMRGKLGDMGIYTSPNSSDISLKPSARSALSYSCPCLVYRGVGGHKLSILLQLPEDPVSDGVGRFLGGTVDPLQEP